MELRLVRRRLVQEARRARIAAARCVHWPRLAREFDQKLQVGPEEREQVEERLRRLLDQVVHFWFPACLTDTGRFRVRHRDEGAFEDGGPDHLVSQASLLWTLARLSSSSVVPKVWHERADGWLERATDTFIHRFWDARHGGFVWAIDGDRVDRRKHLYGQSFALFALAETVCTSGHAGARQACDRLVGVIDQRCRDHRHGGFVESFREDWTALRSDEVSPMNTPGGIKQTNTHVHLLEAFTAYCRATGARERLEELIGIQTDRVVRSRWGVSSDWHRADWTPLLDPEHGRANHGHDVENAWLVLEALSTLGRDPAKHLPGIERSVRTTVRCGWHWQQGGLMRSGPLGRMSDDLDRVWWAQAEALVAFCWLFLATGRRAYWTLFHWTLHWIESHQVDRAQGDWHTVIGPDGRPLGPKALDLGGSAKTPYHHLRALLRCIERLRDHDAPGSDPWLPSGRGTASPAVVPREGRARRGSAGARGAN